jgi:serine/threonine protein kinase
MEKLPMQRNKLLDNIKR